MRRRPVPPVRIERRDHERRRLILHGPPALGEARERRGIPTADEQETPGIDRPGVTRRPRHPRGAPATSGTASAPPTTRIDSGAFVASAAAATSASGPTRRIEFLDGPRPQAGSRGDRLGAGLRIRLRRRAREATQDGVDEPLRTSRHEIHRGGDGGVRRDAGAQLVGPEPQGVPRLGRRHAVERPARRALDRGVEREPATQRAERELGRERAVTRFQARARQQRRQESVRVRAVVDHAADHLEGDRPRGGRGHPRRSPSANRTPRAHADASIRLRPAGATSTSRTPPPPARTRTPRSSTPTTVPGVPSLRW